MNKGRTIAEATRGSLPWREQHLQQSLDRIADTMGRLFPDASIDCMQQVFDARRKLLNRLRHVQRLRKQVAKPNAMEDFQAPFMADHANFLQQMHEGQQ